jgi:hypothetical protein
MQQASNLVRPIKAGGEQRRRAPFALSIRVFTALLSDPSSILDPWNALEKQTCNSIEYPACLFSEQAKDLRVIPIKRNKVD